MTIKTWWLTTHGIQENFYEGSLKEYNPTSRNEKKNQINNLNLYLKQVEKENKSPKVSRRKEIIKSDKKY